MRRGLKSGLFGSLVDPDSEKLFPDPQHCILDIRINFYGIKKFEVGEKFLTFVGINIMIKSSCRQREQSFN